MRLSASLPVGNPGRSRAAAEGSGEAAKGRAHHINGPEAIFED